MALDGDTLVVGDRAGAVGVAGTAYVFTRTGDAWTETAELVPLDAEQPW
ncbi:MAG: hypothetical protein GEU99_12645 [Luteitalea sp.]|nr:hypothetical protein [Luteitalea sp.]